MMLRFARFAACMLLLGRGVAQAAEAASAPAATGSGRDLSLLGLPVARTVDTVETRFGLRAPDPYRWMEPVPNPELTDWLKAQSARTSSYLSSITARDSLFARVRKLGIAYGGPSGAQRAGGRLFHYFLAPGEQLPKLMVRDPDGRERILVDPATRGAAGTHASVNSFAPSPDGSLLAYDLSQGGSEVSTIHVLDVASGRERPDSTERIWGEFAASWLPDGSGFFYTQMAAPAAGADPMLDMRVKLHHLGDPVDRDVTVLVGDHSTSMKLAPEEFPSLFVPPGSSWVVAVAGGAHSEVRLAVVRFADLDRSGAAATRWTTVAEYADGVEQATLDGGRLYLLSHKDASGRKVISVPVEHPDLSRAKVEIPEDPAAPLVRIADAHDALYAARMSGRGALVLRLPWGAARAVAVALPFEGTTNELATDPNRAGAVFDLVGWTRPVEFLAYDPAANRCSTLLKATYPFDLSKVVSEEVEVASTDGALVPLSILRRKDLRLDGSHPAILNGYGGYGVSQYPRFSSTILAWLEQGGVFAVAHVRGGSEKGYAWQIGGTGPNKMNGIRDFIRCGEYLIAKRYTSASKLTADGGSMGGVLVGRAITERPDLFAAAHIAVGILNPVRILAAENGANQKAELGDPETEAGFKALLEMDPYQHVRPGTAYPAVLFTIGLNDRRVAPWMTGKMAARLQASTISGKPVLIRLDPDAGHGVGSTRDQSYAERADVWSFLLAVTGDPKFQPTAP